MNSNYDPRLTARPAERTSNGRTIYQYDESLGQDLSRSDKEVSERQKRILTSPMWLSMSPNSIEGYFCNLLKLTRARCDWSLRGLIEYLCRDPAMRVVSAGQARAMRSAVKKAMTVMGEPLNKADSNRLDAIIDTYQAVENRLEREGKKPRSPDCGAMPLAVLMKEFKTTCDESGLLGCKMYCEAFMVQWAGSFRISELEKLRADEFYYGKQIDPTKPAALLHNGYAHKARDASPENQQTTREIAPELQSFVEGLIARTKLRGPSAHLFPEFKVSASCRVFDYVADKLIKEGVLPEELRWSSHCLRHGGACHIFALTKSLEAVCRRTGHKTLSTAQYYSRPVEMRVQEARVHAARVAERGESDSDDETDKGVVQMDEVTLECKQKLADALRKWSATVGEAGGQASDDGTGPVSLEPTGEDPRYQRFEPAERRDVLAQRLPPVHLHFHGPVPRELDIKIHYQFSSTERCPQVIVTTEDQPERAGGRRGRAEALMCAETLYGITTEAPPRRGVAGRATARARPSARAPPPSSLDTHLPALREAAKRLGGNFL